MSRPTNVSCEFLSMKLIRDESLGKCSSGAREYVQGHYIGGSGAKVKVVQKTVRTTNVRKDVV